MRLLNDEEIRYEIKYVLKNNDLPLELTLKPLCESVATAQHQSDLRGFIELLDNRNLVPQRVADDIKLYLGESFKQMVE